MESLFHIAATNCAFSVLHQIQQIAFAFVRVAFDFAHNLGHSLKSRHIPHTGPLLVHLKAQQKTFRLTYAGCGVDRQMHSWSLSHSGRSVGHRAVTSGGMSHLMRSLVMANDLLVFLSTMAAMNGIFGSSFAFLTIFSMAALVRPRLFQISSGGAP